MCTEVLKSGNENDLDVLCDRAEAYLVNEQFDEGNLLYICLCNFVNALQMVGNGLSIDSIYLICLLLVTTRAVFHLTMNLLSSFL